MLLREPPEGHLTSRLPGARFSAGKSTREFRCRLSVAERGSLETDLAKVPTPVLVCDLSVLDEVAEVLEQGTRSVAARTRLHYAVKATTSASCVNRSPLVFGATSVFGCACRCLC